MMSWKLSLLFFSAVTLHGCLSDAAEPEVQDGISTRDITNLYNQRQGVTYLYKPFNDLPSIPVKGGENKRVYIIKETACLKSENRDLSQCDFKPDGDVEICTWDVDHGASDGIMCLSVSKEERFNRNIRKRCDDECFKRAIHVYIILKLFGVLP
ncbi:cathelicidin-related peptide Oh-Cath-like isoform X1 [Eleutherodactylus coqui]|uniref:cathelicidin-related peptide Oh-Cath-like isoform X1 n=1 Tax=Eleutherodactylus coqui TaxID=57060 RepID=UPI0034635196